MTVVGDADLVWAGPDAESFRRIAAAWQRYRVEVRGLVVDDGPVYFRWLNSLHFQLTCRQTQSHFGSLLLFEAEHGLG
jgi:hypothetical protein